VKLGSFDSLVRALDAASVRCFVAGGLAVNAHGYLRFTRDVDVVLQLSRENIEAAFSAPSPQRISPTPISAPHGPAKRA